MVGQNVIKHKCNCLILFNSTVSNAGHKVVGLLVKNWIGMDKERSDHGPIWGTSPAVT